MAKRQPNAQHAFVNPGENMMVSPSFCLGLRHPGRWVVLLLALWMTWTLSADPSFTAELSQDSVGAGDSVVLKLVFTDLGDVEAPKIPEIPHCTIRYQGASRQFSIVNFKRSSSIIHQYAIQPQQLGQLTIPALTVQVEGKTYTSQPLALQVGKGFDPSSLGFLRLVAPRNDIYVGETFPLEIRFYYKEAPARQAPPTIKSDGFVKGQQTVENLPPETLTNVIYSVVRWNMALTAVKAGELTVGPAEFQTLYNFRVQGRRRSQGLDSLFEPMLGGIEQRQITFQSEPVTFKVLNPPAQGRPPDFNGAVGEFRIAAKASPTQVAAGDPITIQVQISGQGNFDAVRLPDLPAGSGFQLYTGTNFFTPGDPLGLSGTKTFEAVIVPERAGLQTLRWPWIRFWNPNEKAYGVSAAAPLALEVRPGSQAQAQPAGHIAGPPEPRTPPTSVVSTSDLPLLPDLGPWMALSPSAIHQPWYWGLIVLPLVVYGFWTLRPLLASRPMEDPRHMARLQMRQALSNHRRALKEQARPDQASDFFKTLNLALQNQLGLILSGNPGSFTGNDVCPRLEALGVSEEHLRHLTLLFDRLSEARFSPTASAEELPRLAEMAEQVLSALQQLPEVT